MLRMLQKAITSTAPQVTPQVADLLTAIQDDMSREALQTALGLADRKSFRERCLTPALADMESPTKLILLLRAQLFIVQFSQIHCPNRFLLLLIRETSFP